MSTLEPFYFGPSEKPLWGCYHEPDTETRRDCAIIVCYPMGHEYIQFHRACRQLALLLCNEGYPVLRFDFYGCGDSSGDGETGRLDQWLADISIAMGELRRRCGSMKICLTGLRLGGTLAMMAGAQRDDIDGMVLWDPVVEGRTYLEELKTQHRHMLEQAHVRLMPDGKPLEVLGFPITDEMLMDLERIDLSAIKYKPANNILLIESHQSCGQPSLTAHLRSLNVDLKYRHLPNPEFWTWIEDFSHILVPHQILRSIVDWISEVYR